MIAAVFAVVLAVYWPVLLSKALAFDDYQYVVENPVVRNPSWSSAQRFLTEVFEPSTVGGYYQPFTMISLMLDCALGGNESNLIIFHRTSLLLHAANTVLVITLLYILFGNIWVASAVGLLFGIHPMTVETIPWLGERKTLLATFFALWSLLFYVRFTRTTSNKYYAGCIIAYFCALMSKPTSLPLPFVMLLMDYWPLNRLNRQSISEKLPLFTLLVIFGVITVVSQVFSGGGEFPGQAQHSLLNPPLIICHNVVFYLFKMLWPVNLSSHYPYPQPFEVLNPKVFAGIVGTIFLIVLLIVSLRWTRAALAGFLIFFVAILPTMQIFKFSNVIASDKFAYLPCLGPLMILATFILWVYNRRTRRVLIISIVVFLLAGAEATATRRYIANWKDTFTLYNYMLTLSPNAAPLYGNLATAYGYIGQDEKAIELFEHALAIDPNDPQIWFNLGVANYRLKRYQQAVDMFKQSIRLSPYYAELYTNLARAYGAMGSYEEEINLCKKAIELKPDSLDAYITLGSAYGNLGRFTDSIEVYKQAEKIAPQNPQVQYAFGLLYLKTGDTASALRQVEILRHLDPALADKLYSSIPGTN